jgi:hypothetical protein
VTSARQEESVDFDALQDKKRLKKMIEEDETAEDSDLVTEEEGESEGPESDEEASDSPEEPAAEMPSPESLLNSYKLLEQKIAQLEQEAASYRRMFEEVGLSNRGLQRRADEENFMRLMRESFQKDPIETIARMLKRSEEELWQAMEHRIGQVVSEDRSFQQEFARFLDEPKHAFLKPYSQHVEHLIRERGMSPDQVVELFRGIEAKQQGDRQLRSAAAREIRNRSAVESGGDAGEPVDDVKEFDRLIKKAKNLDDMFKILRKVKI